MKKYTILFIFIGIMVGSGYPQSNQPESAQQLRQLADDLTSGQLDKKLSAIEKIGQLNNLPAVKLLLTLTEDKNEKVQSALLSTLGKITDEKAIDWLQLKGVSFPNTAVRQLIIKTLGGIGLKRGKISSALIQALADDELSVRLTATNALGNFPEGIEYLAGPLTSEEYWQLRAEAIKNIAKYRSPKSIDILLNAAGEKDLTLQWQLEEILNEPNEEIFTASEANLLDYLIRQKLSDPDPAVRSIVAKIIGRQLPRLTLSNNILDDYIDLLLKDLGKEEPSRLLSRTWALNEIKQAKNIPETIKQKIPKETIKIWLSLPEETVQIPPDLPTIFANRFGENKTDALLKNGGSAETERAIRKGLHWLSRHQEPGGRWDCAKHNAFQGQIPLPDFTNEYELVDASVTGLSILCFLGAGYTHKSGKYKDTIKKGLEYLISCQDESGLINFEWTHEHTARCLRHGPDHGKLPRRYNHNIGTLTLVETYAMTKDKWLLPYIQKALKHSQDYREPKYGWSFYLEPTDIGPSAYYIMAISIARKATSPRSSARSDSSETRRESEAGDLSIAESEIHDARIYLDKLTQESSGRIYHLEGPPICFGGYDSMATGIFCRLLLRKLGQPDIQTETDKKASEFLIKNLPVWIPYRSAPPRLIEIDQKIIGTEDNILNLWYWYFATLSFLNADYLDEKTKLEYWTRWNEELKSVLLKHQRIGGDWDGSWDPVGAWGSVGGRIYSTTFGILTLQTYYSYNFNR